MTQLCLTLAPIHLSSMLEGWHMRAASYDVLIGEKGAIGATYKVHVK